MGDAFVSIADDASATYWNPAGLSQIQTPEVLAMQNAGLVDTQYQYLAGVLPLKDGAMGLSVSRLDYGSIDRYTASDAKDGSFTAGSLAGNISYSRKVAEDVMMGLSVKYVEESIESEKASSFAGDLGILVKRGRINFGGALQHFGPGMKMVRESSPLPMTVRVGASTRFMDDRLLASVDASKPNDENVTFHTGVEYHIVPMLALRGGYALTPGSSTDLGGLTGISAGLGIVFNRFNLDYSVTPFGDLGLSHRFSLLARFGSSN
jgi:long-subunit fatty acid transport protein